MAKDIYAAQAHVVGGRTEGHGVTSDGNLDVQLRRPKEMGGDGTGTNPEQLFAVGYAACFESALQVVGQREKADLGELAVDSRVALRPNGDGGFELTVGLDVSLPGVAADDAVAIVRTAHAVCPYSNATRGNIDVALTVNGQAVD